MTLKQVNSILGVQTSSIDYNSSSGDGTLLWSPNNENRLGDLAIYVRFDKNRAAGKGWYSLKYVSILNYFYKIKKGMTMDQVTTILGNIRKDYDPFNHYPADTGYFTWPDSDETEVSEYKIGILFKHGIVVDKNLWTLDRSRSTP